MKSEKGESASILRRAIAGQLALWKAFWGIFVSLLFALYGVYYFVLWFLLYDPYTRLDRVAAIFAVIIFVCMLTASVAVWRCAENTSLTLWKWLARSTVVLYIAWYAYKSVVLALALLTL